MDLFWGCWCTEGHCGARALNEPEVLAVRTPAVEDTGLPLSSELAVSGETATGRHFELFAATGLPSVEPGASPAADEEAGGAEAPVVPVAGPPEHDGAGRLASGGHPEKSSAKPCATVATRAAPDVEECPAKPDFSGHWLLKRCEGNADAFLNDMGQPWLIRTAARGFHYGVGRVVVKCRQRGDNMDFSKRLTDPRVAEQTIQFKVNDGSVSFRDDIGRLTATSRWEERVLRFTAVLDGANLPMTMLMYLNGEGNFVEEMVSCKGTVLKYVFHRHA